MPSTYCQLTKLEYLNSTKINGKIRSYFAFEGGTSGGENFDVGAIWSVSMSNTAGPMMMLIKQPTASLPPASAKILESSSSGTTYTGKLEIYSSTGTLFTEGGTYYIQSYDEYGTPVTETSFTVAIGERSKNLASGTLKTNISASTTSIQVTVDGSGSYAGDYFPDTNFYATIMPAVPAQGVSNAMDSEIVLVTDKIISYGSDTTLLTVVRAQKGTTAKAFTQGAILTNAIYADDMVFVEDGSSHNRKLKDKDGNIFYPDVGADLDNMVFAEDPTTPVPSPTPWVGSDDIVDSAVGDNKINWETMEHCWRKYYDYTIPRASGWVHYDVPVDLLHNRRVKLYFNVEQEADAGWTAAQMYDNNGNVKLFSQTGYECSAGSMGFVHRFDFDQIIAWGGGAWSSINVEIELSRASTGNWVTYKANSLGDTGNGRCSQCFQGRMNAGAEAASFVRFHAYSPSGNGSLIGMVLK